MVDGRYIIACNKLHAVNCTCNDGFSLPVRRQTSLRKLTTITTREPVKLRVCHVCYTARTRLGCLLHCKTDAWSDHWSSIQMSYQHSFLSQHSTTCTRGATTFSKLGVQFLGLGYYTEQNTDGIPSFVHCNVLRNGNHTLHQESWGGPTKFWGSRPPPRLPSGCASDVHACEKWTFINTL